VPEVTLLVFRSNQASNIVAKFGYAVRGGRIIDSHGKRARCANCQRELTVDHLGRVMPGSYELLCDDLICFNAYAVRLVE